MENEIKIRKKRFAAFWTTVLLICCLIVPMAAYGTTASQLATMNYATIFSGTLTHTDSFTVIYRNYDHSEINTYTHGGGETHSVIAYPYDSDDFFGWYLSVSGLDGHATAVMTAQMQSSTPALYSSGGVAYTPIVPGPGQTLSSGKAYVLNGATKVAGDPSTYVDGSVFYCDGGTYDFS